MDKDRRGGGMGGVGVKGIPAMGVRGGAVAAAAVAAAERGKKKCGLMLDKTPCLRGNHTR